MVNMNDSLRSSRRLRSFLLVAAACCSASVGVAAGSAPAKPEELFRANRVWSVHLTLTPEAWKEMQPTGGPPQFFGGPPPGGGAPVGPPPGGPGPGGPGGPGAPPFFSPGGMLTPHLMADGDGDKDGKLTKAEFRAVGARWFAEWDGERRGKIGAEEVRDGLSARIMRPAGGPGGGGPGFGGISLQGPQGGPNGLAAMLGIKFKWVKAAVDFEGATLRNAGLRYKGNGTYVESQASLKRPMKLDVARFEKGRKLAGVETINLHNSVADPSWMNDVLAYRLFREAGVPAPRTSYARVFLTVPGTQQRQYLGLYELVEDVDDDFLLRSFGSKNGALLKPSTPRPFTYLGEDWKAYEQSYEPKSKMTPAQQRRIIELCKLVSDAPDAEFADKIGSYVDLEPFARFMAATVLMSDLDSILLTGQNYYTYLDPKTQKLRFIAWDKDHSFGYFPMGSPEEREQLSLTRPWQGENPFLKRVFRVPAFRTPYLARIKELNATHFRPERLARQVTELAAAIRPAIREESPEKLARFEKVIAGEGVAPSAPGMSGPPGFLPAMKPLKPFVAMRIESVESQLAGKSTGKRIPVFGPGMFIGPAWLTALDSKKDSVLTQPEMVGGFERWFAEWTAGGAALTTETLKAGINRALLPPGFQFPGAPGPGGR